MGPQEPWDRPGGPDRPGLIPNPQRVRRFGWLCSQPGPVDMGSSSGPTLSLGEPSIYTSPGRGQIQPSRWIFIGIACGPKSSVFDCFPAKVGPQEPWDRPGGPDRPGLTPSAQAILIRLHRCCRMCSQPGPVDMGRYSGPWGNLFIISNTPGAGAKTSRTDGHG
jgi:hypothetical protein